MRDFGAQQKFHVRLIRGIEWIIEIGAVHLRQFRATNISSHADNLIGLAVASIESLTKRVLSRPKTLRKRLVDNRDQRSVINLLFAENASLQQRNPQRLEKIWRHGIEAGEALLFATHWNDRPNAI